MTHVTSSTFLAMARDSRLNSERILIQNSKDTFPLFENLKDKEVLSSKAINDTTKNSNTQHIIKKGN